MTSGGRRSLALAGDVTREGDLERAGALARREFGRLDVAVANAVVRTLLAALPALRETRGRIVLIGSMSG